MQQEVQQSVFHNNHKKKRFRNLTHKKSSLMCKETIQKQIVLALILINRFVCVEGNRSSIEDKYGDPILHTKSNNMMTLAQYQPLLHPYMMIFHTMRHRSTLRQVRGYSVVNVAFKIRLQSKEFLCAMKDLMYQGKLELRKY